MREESSVTPFQGFEECASSIIKLTVKEVDGEILSGEYQVHELVLTQLPYFATLFQDKWKSDTINGDNACNLILPLFSTIDDFDCLIRALYRGTTPPKPQSVARSIGLISLLKFMQVDGQMIKKGIIQLRSLSFTDNQHRIATIAMLEQYDTMTDVISAILSTELMFDDDTFKVMMEQCDAELHHVKLLSAALASRATFGLSHQDTFTILRYLTCQPLLEITALPAVSKLRLPKPHGRMHWPDRLAVAPQFSSLWSVVKPQINSSDTFHKATGIFKGIYSGTVDTFVTTGCGSWSNSRKTHYPGSTTYHSMATCGLVQFFEEQEQEGQPQTRNSILCTALQNLIFIGIDLLKGGAIEKSALFDLLDFGSKKFADHVDGCDDAECVAMRELPRQNCLELDDFSLKEVMDLVSKKLDHRTCVDVAKYLLKSHCWGMASLGPLVTKSVQNMLLG